MINKYLWDNYLKAGGNDVVAMFERNLRDELTTEYADEVRKFHKEHLMDLAKANVCRLEYSVYGNDSDFTREKDVEN